MTAGSPPRGIAERLARHLPEMIAVNPERALIYLGCVLIGLSALVPSSHGVLQHLWPFAQYEWGAAMLVGGVAAFIGLLRRQHPGERPTERSTERLGMLLILFGSLFLAVILVVKVGLVALITALIFIFISVAMAIRLTVSSAVRTANIQLGVQMKEADQPGGES